MTSQYKSHPLYQEELDGILSVKNIGCLAGKTVLITGATGLIGTQMIDALMKGNRSEMETTVIAVGRNEKKARERFGEYFGGRYFRFLAQDAAKPFPDSLRPDYIIPLASFTHPLAFSRYPVETMMTNLKGAENALALAEKCGAAVMYPSSGEIYGNSADGRPFTESDTGRLDLSSARACYNEAKRSSEAMCQAFRSEYGIDVKIARLCRVFGPTILPDDTKASSQFIAKAVAGEDIVLKSDGRQQFSYIYAADAVSALLHIMLNGESGAAYNVANDDCNVRLKDFAEACAKIAGSSVIFDVPSETERRGYSIASSALLDCSRLRATGWEPQYPPGEALRRTIEMLAFQNAQTR